MLYTHLPYHNDSIIKTHAERRKRKTQEETTQEQLRCKKEDTRRLLYNYSYLSLYCKGSKGLFKGLHVRGCWRPNVNFIFWPHCYDRHVVSCSPDVGVNFIGGFRGPPQSGCDLPYHISSLTLSESAGNCSGTQTQLS